MQQEGLAIATLGAVTSDHGMPINAGRAFGQPGAWHNPRLGAGPTTQFTRRLLLPAPCGWNSV